MKTVRDVLKGKASKEVWSTRSKAKVFEALGIMADKGIGAVMVADDKGKMVGIMTERDYARKIILQGRLSKNTQVAEIMTPLSDMFVVKPTTKVEDCMLLMTEKKVRHLPVFDEGNFVGIISIGDVLKSIISEQQLTIEHLSHYIAGEYT
jgi:CBS domain-containing protein